MTNQDAFTTVVQHLRTQGAPSYSSKHGGCSYRADDGIRRCAVGVLIPDAQYSPQMEGRTLEVSDEEQLIIGMRGLTPIPVPEGVSREMMRQLQLVHDMAVAGPVFKQDLIHRQPLYVREGFLEGWEKGFKAIARVWNLEVPPHPLQQAPKAAEQLDCAISV